MPQFGHPSVGNAVPGSGCRSPLLRPLRERCFPKVRTRGVTEGIVSFVLINDFLLNSSDRLGEVRKKSGISQADAVLDLPPSPSEIVKNLTSDTKFGTVLTPERRATSSEKITPAANEPPPLKSRIQKWRSPVKRTKPWKVFGEPVSLTPLTPHRRDRRGPLPI